LSRFISESRFSNAVNKLPRMLPPDTRLGSQPTSNRGTSEWSSGNGDGTGLDDYAQLPERDIVSRHGIFRRSFRSNGPEVSGDGTNG
jgi:hypothetical protein